MTTRNDIPVSSPRRLSSRNTNNLRFPEKCSLQYRRLNELFFRESSSPSSSYHPLSVNNTSTDTTTTGSIPIQQQSDRSCRQLLQNDTPTQSKPATNNTKVALQPNSFPEAARTVNIGSLHLQQVHTSPNIYVIDNFLKPSELNHLLHIARVHQFQKSFMDTAGCNDNDMTTNDGKYTNNVVYDNQHRTSTFVRFPKNHDAKIRTIEQRAADLLGYYSSVNAVECLQLVRYKPGQFFGVHHDLGEYNEEQKRVKLPPRIWYAKRRLVTLFCYLNSVGDDFTNVTRENTNNAETNLTGGATYFPSAHQLRVQPQAGRAVLFCNVLENGQPDVRTIHAGEPVIKRPMPLNDAQRITSAQRAMPPVVNQDEAKYGLNIWLLET